MSQAFDFDAVIVGAGPAGTSTAIRLAILGLNVAIIESRTFPRAHVGICISDQTTTLLDFLGVGAEFRKADFWRRNLTAVSWGNARRHYVEQRGFHVDRGLLDQFLMRKACEAGVTRYQPAQAVEFLRLEGSGWQVGVSQGSDRFALTARFIVDAAGRRSAMRGQRIRDGLPLIAIHARWKLSAQADFDGLIEAGEDAWLWYAQTAKNEAVCSVFCDPRDIKLDLKDDLQSRYSRLLRQFDVFQSDRLGQQCTSPAACDAAGHYAANPIGDDHLQVGDACLSVDPLSSQGVHLALQTGVQAAIVVHTILMKPQNMALAKDFYRSRMGALVDRYNRQAKNEYARVSNVRSGKFWKDRSGGLFAPTDDWNSPKRYAQLPSSQVRVILSPLTAIQTAPVIDGQYVEEKHVLTHPSIVGAFAYVGGVNIVDLISALPERCSYQEVLDHWSESLPIEKGCAIASWLWQNRILVEANETAVRPNNRTHSDRKAFDRGFGSL